MARWEDVDDADDVMFRKEPEPERILWSTVLAAQMTGSKEGLQHCRRFWFSEHCRILCRLLDLNLELLKQEALNPRPMYEPSPAWYYLNPGDRFKRQHKFHRQQITVTLTSDVPSEVVSHVS